MHFPSAPTAVKATESQRFKEVMKSSIVYDRLLFEGNQRVLILLKFIMILFCHNGMFPTDMSGEMNKSIGLGTIETRPMLSQELLRAPTSLCFYGATEGAN